MNSIRARVERVTGYLVRENIVLKPTGHSQQRNLFQKKVEEIEYVTLVESIQPVFLFLRKND